MSYNSSTSGNATLGKKKTKLKTKKTPKKSPKKSKKSK